MFRNKLGFYIQVSQGVHDWITATKPPVVLMHAWDQGLLEEIRRFRSPDSFVIGRMDYIRRDGLLPARRSPRNTVSVFHIPARRPS